MNPYAEWLLIECQDRPDHYALLGVERFESDPLKIVAATDRRVAQLRKAATKERLDVAKRVAREITEARDCLLSTETRTAYESRLRGPAPSAPRSVFLPPKAYDDEIEAEIDAAIEDDDAPLEGIAIPPSFSAPLSAVAVEMAVAAPPIVAPTPPEPSLAVRAPSALPGRKGLPLLWLIAGSGALGLIAVLAVVLVPKWLTPTPTIAATIPATATPAEVRTDFGFRPTAFPTDGPPASAFNPENPTPAPTVATTPAPPPMAEPNPTMEDAGDDTMAATPEMPPMTEPPATTPPMETMVPPAAPTTPTAGMLSAEAAAENVKATQANLAIARRAMSDGDIDEAVAQVELADLEAIDGTAADQVAETRAVLEYLRGFWRAADEGFLGLAAGDEFEFDGRTVVVVERTPQRLVIRSAGRNRGYERKQLPSKLALFLATRWLKPDDANSPLFLAAFHTLDADGDRAEARKLAETARAANTPGAEVLLAELEAPQ